MAKKNDPNLTTRAPAKGAKTATAKSTFAAPTAVAKPAAAKKKIAPKSAKPKVPAYTQDDVALRAYFIAEKRRESGLPGDEHQDWIEAERQLASNGTKPKKAKKS